MSTSSTQNETTIRGSEIEYVKKNSKAALLNHLKRYLLYFFYYFYSLLWLSSMTSKKFQSEIKLVQNLELQTIGAFLYFNNCNKNIIISKPSPQESWSQLWYFIDTKFGKYFSLFENLAKNLQEEHSISNKMIAEEFSCIKTQQPNFQEFGNAHTN